MTPAAPDLPPSGRLTGGEHTYPLRVYYEDTDLSGVVYHANYLRWMERARTEMLRCAGIDHRSAHADAGYAVTSIAIRYHAPARLDDALVVTSRLTHARAASIAIQQTVSRGTVVLADADVVAALVAADGRPRRQPRAWLALYQGLLSNGSILGDA